MRSSLSSFSRQRVCGVTAGGEGGKHFQLLVENHALKSGILLNFHIHNSSLEGATYCQELSYMYIGWVDPPPSILLQEGGRVYCANTLTCSFKVTSL